MNKLLQILLFSIATIIFFSCEKPFEREQELMSYLKEIHSLKLNDKQHIIILQTNFCGACTKSVVEYVSQKTSDTKIPVTIILSENVNKVVNQINENKNKSTDLLIDRDYGIEKYGLRYPSDLFFTIEDNDIAFWSYITEDKFKKINRNIGELVY